MGVASITFNSKDQPEFIKELRSKVALYFKERSISRYANGRMKVKTVFMICLYFIPLAVLISGILSSVWMIMLMWFLMSLGMSGIGLSIMHDANHGSYSRNPRTNKLLGYLVNFLGAYHVNWKIQHNVLHHSFTNVEGHDEDISVPVMRLSPNQKRKKLFRFQAYYAPFLYGLMTINWFVAKDYISLVKYHRRKLLEGQGTTMRRALFEVIFNKIWYFVLVLIIPIMVLDIPWWLNVVGFFMMQFLCGLFLALIFQPAHVIEETNFYDVGESGSIENSWAIHQMRTTANFARKSRLFSWFIGGLNYQIEHHLFPNICHIHYKKISKIVKETAEKFDLPYHQHKTFYSALRSHFSLLNQLGTGSYDKALVKATL